VEVAQWMTALLINGTGTLGMPAKKSFAGVLTIAVSRRRSVSVVLEQDFQLTSEEWTNDASLYSRHSQIIGKGGHEAKHGML
jgi:hypothetical protein